MPNFWGKAVFGLLISILLSGSLYTELVLNIGRLSTKVVVWTQFMPSFSSPFTSSYIPSLPLLINYFSPFSTTTNNQQL